MPSSRDHATSYSTETVMPEVDPFDYYYAEIITLRAIALKPYDTCNESYHYHAEIITLRAIALKLEARDFVNPRMKQRL